MRHLTFATVLAAGIIAGTAPAPAQSQNPDPTIRYYVREALMSVDPADCGVLQADLDRFGKAMQGEMTNTVLVQLRASVASYCRAREYEEELNARGFRSTSRPPLGADRSLSGGSLDGSGVATLDPGAAQTVSPDLGAELIELNEERISYVESADVFLDFAIQADPDAANDLLRRLLGTDPLEKTLK